MMPTVQALTAMALSLTSAPWATAVQEQASRGIAGQESAAVAMQSALARYLDELPMDAFEFEVHESSGPPAAGEFSEALKAYEVAIRARIEAMALPADEVRRVEEQWRSFAESHVRFVERQIPEQVDFLQRFSIRFGPDSTESKVHLRPGPSVDYEVMDAWNSTLILADERVQVLTVLRKNDGGGMESRRDAQRMPREVQDVERYDSTRWLIHARGFVRSLLQSLMEHPKGWRCSIEGEEYVARWDMEVPASWPGFAFYQGAFLGSIEVRIDIRTGAPNAFSFVDQFGRKCHEILYGDFQGSPGLLPLSMQVRTWYPGTGGLRSELVFKGRQLRGSPVSTYEELVPKGTHVTDSRFFPPVSYVEESPRVPDERIIELSSHAARPIGSQGRTDVQIPRAASTESSAPEGEPEDGPGREAWPDRSILLRGLGIALIVGAIAWIWWLRGRARAHGR